MGRWDWFDWRSLTFFLSFPFCSTISWMDAIKRQFGLSHIDYSVPPKT